MKYAIIIPDGAADLPLEQLGGKTPLEAARTPALDRLASMGRVGRAATTPPGFGAGSDVCTMSLMGYDPAMYHTGRAPLEAAAMGLRAGRSDWLFRVNLVTLDGDAMRDHSAGGISDGEAASLIEGLARCWRDELPELSKGLELHHGVSYRSILLDREGLGSAELRTTPPHEIPGEPIEEHMPIGDPDGRVRQLMDASRAFLSGHEVNLARAARGERTADMAWIWGQGTAPAMPSFEERFGLRGAMITAVDLLAGLAACVGWDRLVVPGVTSYHDNDYAAQGAAAARALADYDVVCCHVESPDEASHQADWKTKVEAIEAIDEHVVAPIVEALGAFGDAERDSDAEGWRVLVLPDHFTLVSTRKHDATPVPFVMAGAWVRTLVERPFSEAGAAGSDLEIGRGHDLMEYFLRGGLAQVPGRAPRG